SLGLPFSEIFTWMVIATEMGGALFLLIGLFVRWVTIPMLVVTTTAIVLVHWQNGWAQESNGIEMAVTYSIMLIILLFTGGGKFLSLDYWISRD
ncbi:MAG TPA: DoxX family protein, partial [Gammaproteobacteria bacterium]|nr:DoxX family protein [Gammaproteobacteria bacterium]